MVEYSMYIMHNFKSGEHEIIYATTEGSVLGSASATIKKLPHNNSIEVTLKNFKPYEGDTEPRLQYVCEIYVNTLSKLNDFISHLNSDMVFLMQDPQSMTTYHEKAIRTLHGAKKSESLETSLIKDVNSLNSLLNYYRSNEGESLFYQEPLTRLIQ